MNRKFLTLVILSVCASITFSNPAVANSQIVINGNKYAKKSENYSVSLQLKAKGPIQLKAHLINIHSEKLNGTPELIKGSNQDGTWRITWKISSNVRTGEYKLSIQAISGNETLRIPNKTITIVESSASNQSRPRLKKSNIIYGLKATCGQNLTNCPTLSTDLESVDANLCKIKDLTYPDDSDGWVASGFPPPKFSLAGQKNVKLLLIPVNFADKKIDNKTYESAKETVKRAENFYSFNSYERVNFKFEVLSLEQGVNLTDKVSEYEKTWANKNTDVTQFLLDRAKYSGTELVDAIMWLFPLGKYRIDQMPFDPKYKTYTFNGQVLPASRVYGLHVELNSIGAHGFDHGAGHALYSFEDLYLGAHNSTTGKIEQPGNGWDVMIGGGEFFGWSRWLASWLLDSEVYCVFDSNKPVVVYLKALQDPAGKKLLAMRINDGKVVLAEYRTNTPKYISTKYQVCLDKKFTPCNYQYHHSGVLLYNLDTSRKHSGAPYRVAMETDEKLLSVGENLKYENVIFSVLAADSEGIYLQAKKID